jgi:hypothetical protein
MWALSTAGLRGPLEVATNRWLTSDPSERARPIVSLSKLAQ